MELLSGKVVANAIKEDIKQQVEEMMSSGIKRPCLAAIIVGNDGASLTYVGHKEKACAELGIESVLYTFNDDITQADLVAKIKEINENDKIDGLIVQLPLPKHIDELRVIRAIDPVKDVDGFHLENVGRMMLGFDSYLPATPAGIIELLKYYKIETSGKNCVVLGRSNIVGRPIANMLSAKKYPGDCTVTICHSRTPNIEEFTRRADIIIVAIGSPEFLTADMVKDGVVIVDVGVHRVPDATMVKGYRIVGDVKFDEVAPRCSYITPVPGGVGVMTIVSLMKNTLQAAIRRENIRLGIW